MQCTAMRAAILLSIFSPLFAQDGFVVWDFVPSTEFFATCKGMATELGDNTANPVANKAVCMKHVGSFKEASEEDKAKNCAFVAEQMEQATLQERWKGPADFCKKLLMLNSYKLKSDLINYLKPKDWRRACADSISLAVEQGAAGTTKAEAVAANLPMGCKETVEGMFRKNGMPIPIATVACKAMVGKANIALEAGELNPDDQGKQFCDGNSLQAKPFEASAKSPMPEAFPLTKADWKPKVTLAHLQEMVRHAYKTPMAAFKKFDLSGDGQLDSEEWQKMCGGLGIPTWDCQILKKQADVDANSKVSKAEFQNAMGVTVPELVAYSNAKHGNSEKGWKAAD